MIYFDNAATSGVKPQSVIDSVTKAMKEFNSNPGRSGHSLSLKTADAIYKVREKIASLFGASGPERVIFTLNCTHSINCVLKGVLGRGDHIIVSSFEHNAVMRPLNKLGVSYSIANVSLTDDEQTVKNFEEKIRPNTRMVFCTGASNVFGKILPIKEIGNLCRKKGILFGVDAAQTAGVIPINMKEMCIDFLCIAPHKGLYAPMGCGILISEKSIPKTVLEGGTGTNSVDYFQPEFYPEKHESGTLNVPTIFGIGAGIDFVKKITPKKIYAHELNLAKEVYRKLKIRDDIILYTPEPLLWGYAPVISFNFKEIDSANVSRILSDFGVAVRGGLHCAPLAHNYMGTLDGGAVRLSFGSFNTGNEVERFLRLINSENFLKKLKFSIE